MSSPGPDAIIFNSKLDEHSSNPLHLETKGEGVVGAQCLSVHIMFQTVFQFQV